MFVLLDHYHQKNGILHACMTNKKAMGAYYHCKNKFTKKPYFPEDSCALMQAAEVEVCSGSHSLAQVVTFLSTDNDVVQARSENLALKITRSNSPTDSLSPQIESMECDNDEIPKIRFTC
ncbi:uncharacterized protein RHIMIDRAFT_290003 [Rhizopus microsporus ATCC 52813]|uniref:Uncharacterized protein n=1 Tax=Rhizopus microsporus ATCC 52813 TaxID=1340429 RepID=A0A2G4T3Q7_RHIZD|nr:uncharacterized protein RHIMIDRAFT_290003 [Rhizopus microsporus ATCC 52813]PHZ15647.1 hypothetical protein RHIMIDRAFT_290003 [Rhizopus microsporus ATCC 52813]